LTGVLTLIIETQSHLEANGSIDAFGRIVNDVGYAQVFLEPGRATQSFNDSIVTMTLEHGANTVTNLEANGSKMFNDPNRAPSTLEIIGG
jgi:hypothetical protein